MWCSAGMMPRKWFTVACSTWPGRILSRFDRLSDHKCVAVSFATTSNVNGELVRMCALCQDSCEYELMLHRHLLFHSMDDETPPAEIPRKPPKKKKREKRRAVISGKRKKFMWLVFFFFLHCLQWTIWWWNYNICMNNMWNGMPYIHHFRTMDDFNLYEYTVINGIRCSSFVRENMFLLRLLRFGSWFQYIRSVLLGRLPRIWQND